MKARSIFIFLISCNLVYAASENKKSFFNDVTISSYLDGSYNYLYQSNQFTSGVYDRGNDSTQNGLTLQQAFLSISKDPEQGFGGFIDFMLGKDAYLIQPLGMNANVLDSQDMSFVIPQAYVQFKNKSNFFQLGALQTVAGFEQYDYSKNLNFSFSILNVYAEPGTHIGLRNTYNMSDHWQLISGIGNGWSTIEQPYHQDTIELGINYIAPQFSWTIDTLSGYNYLASNLTSGPTSWRNLLDIFGTLNVTEQLSLSANYDYAYQNKVTLQNGDEVRALWQGIAGYLGYTINEKWRTALRGEIFYDQQGFITGIRQTWREVTLSLAYLPIKNLQCRFETRRDISNTNAFLSKNGIKTANNQQSYSLDILYEF